MLSSIKPNIPTMVCSINTRELATHRFIVAAIIYLLLVLSFRLTQVDPRVLWVQGPLVLQAVLVHQVFLAYHHVLEVPRVLAGPLVLVVRVRQVLPSLNVKKSVVAIFGLRKGSSVWPNWLIRIIGFDQLHTIVLQVTSKFKTYNNLTTYCTWIWRANFFQSNTCT